MKKPKGLVLVLLTTTLFLVAACSSESSQTADPTTAATEPAQVATAEPPEPPEPTEPPPTDEPLPTETPLPPTEPPEPTATPLPTDTLEPTATIDYQPLVPIGSTADWTATNDAIGIEGTVEFISATQIRIRDFVFLAAEAPGVDIRLGIDGNFEDGIAVSLIDITGDTYEGRNLTLTIPDEAFDGREFNSIGVVCYDNGEVFDWVLIELSAG